MKGIEFGQPNGHVMIGTPQPSIPSGLSALIHGSPLKIPSVHIY